MTNAPLVVRLHEASQHTRLAGGKAAALSRCMEAGLLVPDGCVVLPSAVAVGVGAAPGSTPREFSLTPEARILLELELTRLAEGGSEPVRFAVRSSAAEEDGAEHSFAGQFESFLAVPKEEVEAKIGAVWASAFSERACAYRRERGVESAAVSLPGVLIQRMVPAEAAGVAFSVDPVSAKRDIAVVSGVWGLGQGLVSGEVDADIWHVDRAGHITYRTVAFKQNVWRIRGQGESSERLDEEENMLEPSQASDGTEVSPAEDRASLPELTSPPAESVAPGTLFQEKIDPIEAALPCLGDASARDVAALARRCATFFGNPQDIEWATVGGTLYLLQSRPITTLRGRPDPSAPSILWDNSNIAESYNGLTTPLTFSFARHAYEQVYREFCRILRVPQREIAAASPVFRGMLGFVRGRIYYNLIHWHQVLALLPGYKWNKEFMEQMMGVREPLPARFAPMARPKAGFLARGFDLARLLRTVGALVGQHRKLPQTAAAFQDRLESSLRTAEIPVRDLRPDELAAHYRELEARLLCRWDAPLINDFFAMLFFGILRKLTAKWLGDTTGSFAAGLVAGNEALLSAEPALLLREMAELLRPHDDLRKLWQSAPAAEALREVKRLPELAERFDYYLGKFGERCAEELKLETVPLVDDPTPLVRAVAALADLPAELQQASRASEVGLAEGPETTRLPRGVKGWLFHIVLRQALRHLALRETLRLERTRIFGRVRTIFRTLGARYVELGLLDAAEDIFFLTIDEALGAVDGTASVFDLRKTAQARRTDFEALRAAPAPPDRFVTCGPVLSFLIEEAPSSPSEGAEGDELVGTGSSHGIVRGRARVITDPTRQRPLKGEILVAQRTDPGWVLLFPMAAGVLVEFGSLLSHSAIVARELRIPAVVGIANLTARLKTGDLVEMNGQTGHVVILEKSRDPEAHPGS